MFSRCSRRAFGASTAARSLDAKTRAVVDATAPAVAANVFKITGEFYPLMFEKHPEVLAFFNPSNQRKGTQSQALANAVVACTQHLDRLDADLSPALQLIAHKHCALGVQPEHYQVVHDCFLAATAKVLGADVVTAEIADAWSKVLMLIAGNLIGREAALYKHADETAGRWTGTRPFTIERIEDAASDARSFYLAPADGKEQATWTPGQYVTVTNKLDTESGYSAPRHYTVSHHSTFRITPKRDGAMSTLLHSLKEGDTLHLNSAFGEFVHDSVKPQQNDVYIAGGIGVTPLAALAGQAHAAGRDTALLHAAVEHPLFDETPATFKHKGNEEMADTVLDRLRDAGWQLDNSRFFMCGPVEMLRKTHKHLTDNGIDAQNIRYEVFGPLAPMRATQ